MEALGQVLEDRSLPVARGNVHRRGALVDDLDARLRAAGVVDEDRHVLAVREGPDLALGEDDAFLLVVEHELEMRRLDRLEYRLPDGVVGLAVDLRGAGALGVSRIDKARRAAGARGQDEQKEERARRHGVRREAELVLRPLTQFTVDCRTESRRPRPWRACATAWTDPTRDNSSPRKRRASRPPCRPAVQKSWRSACRPA